jgi:hypothetical protein
MSNVYDRPFTVTIGEIRKGALANELTEQLAALVAGVMTIGKPGKLTLSLRIKPAAKSADMVLVEDEVTLSAPRPDRPQSLFFATDDGGLARHNPNQPELPFRQVPPAEEA